MKTIEVKKQNLQKIMNAFCEKQGRATVRDIYDFSQIEDIVNKIEKRLSIPKKSMNGIYIHYDHRQHFPNAYKYRPESTHFDLINKGGKWYIDLDSVQRATCPNKNTDYPYTIALSDTAKEEILKKYI